MFLCVSYRTFKTIPRRDNSFLLIYTVVRICNTGRECTTNTRPKFGDNKRPDRIGCKIYADDCLCGNDPDSVCDCNKYLHRRHSRETDGTRIRPGTVDPRSVGPNCHTGPRGDQKNPWRVCRHSSPHLVTHAVRAGPNPTTRPSDDDVPPIVQTQDSSDIWSCEYERGCVSQKLKKSAQQNRLVSWK